MRTSCRLERPLSVRSGDLRGNSRKWARRAESRPSVRREGGRHGYARSSGDRVLLICRIDRDRAHRSSRRASALDTGAASSIHLSDAAPFDPKMPLSQGVRASPFGRRSADAQRRRLTVQAPKVAFPPRAADPCTIADVRFEANLAIQEPEASDRSSAESGDPRVSRALPLSAESGQSSTQTNWSARGIFPTGLPPQTRRAQ